MPKIMHVHIGLFSPETCLVALAETAAVHELVLISAHHVLGGGRLAILRQALAPRRLVALLVADDLPPIERTVIDELLNDGVIPVIIPAGEGPTAALMSWLDSDERSFAGADRRGAARRVPGPPLHRRPWGCGWGGNDADDPRRAA